MAGDRPDREPATLARRLPLLVAILGAALLLAAPPPSADGSGQAEQGQGPGGAWVVAGSTGGDPHPWGLVGKAGGGPPGLMGGGPPGMMGGGPPGGEDGDGGHPPMMGGDGGWTGYGPMIDGEDDEEGVSTLAAVGLFAGGALLGGLLVLAGVMLGRRG